MGAYGEADTRGVPASAWRALTTEMRIAIDMRPTTLAGTGIARYAASLAAALDARPDLIVHQLHKIDPGAAQLVRGKRVVSASPLWLQVFVPLYCARAHVQVFHGTNFVVPLARRCAQVATIHDLTVITHPHLHTLRNRLVTGIQMRVGVRRCDIVITDSNSTARDLAVRYPWLRERIRVIHLSVAAHFRPASSERIDALRRQYQLVRPYVLFVGHQEPRKNLLALLEAVRLCRERGVWDHDLVLAGRRGPETSALRRRASELDLEADVRHLGVVADDDLPVLMSGATLFVYPSLTEGFGLPVLEAMACGVPTVTTDDKALREVAGDAAVYAQSPSAGHIADAMASLLTDEHYRGERALTALKHAAGRTWSDVACETAHVYKEAYELWRSERSGSR
jgi:glycosyltransferase involved in cell wall biosynthesis